jgi:hypothetical protein
VYCACMEASQFCVRVYVCACLLFVLFACALSSVFCSLYNDDSGINHNYTRVQPSVGSWQLMYTIQHVIDMDLQQVTAVRPCPAEDNNRR